MDGRGGRGGEAEPFLEFEFEFSTDMFIPGWGRSYREGGRIAKPSLSFVPFHKLLSRAIPPSPPSSATEKGAA